MLKVRKSPASLELAATSADADSADGGCAEVVCGRSTQTIRAEHPSGSALEVLMKLS